MVSRTSKTSPDTPIQRGDKATDPASVGVFVLGRLIDPLCQYAILARGYGSSLITTLGGDVLPQGPALVTGSALDVGLSPARTALLSMSVIAMLKQNIHATSIMQERLTPTFAAQVGLFNLTFDSVNSLLYTCAQTSASNNGQIFPQTPFLIGSALFATGIAIELGSEVQRLLFKRDPANKGKVYQGGLFGLSRHINYFGYTLWRSGYAMASGGYTWAAVTGAFFIFTFVKSSIPELQSSTLR